MTNIISGNGTTATIQADNGLGGGTYPWPIPIDEWAQDVDAIEFSDVPIGDGKKGPNGQMAAWSISETLEVTVAPIVGSNTDRVFQTLFQANRPSQGKSSAQDNITLTIVYPDLISSLQMTGGIMTSGSPGKGLGSDGKLKTRTYKFKFNNYSGGF